MTCTSVPGSELLQLFQTPGLAANASGVGNRYTLAIEMLLPKIAFRSSIPGPTVKKRSQTKKWAEVRKVLVRGDAEMLIDLVRELYDASPANQDFLHTRLKVNEDHASALKPYLDRITGQFKIIRGDVKLNLAEARRAIREYRKATKNVPGTIELMLTYVECGTGFTLNYGDIDARFYSSLSSVLREMANLVCSEGRDYYPRFRDRIQKLSTDTERIGWCYGDFLRETVLEIKSSFRKE